MTSERAQRRLAAILSADVVGYSKLVRADEKATLDRLRTLFDDTVAPRIAAHGGRIVKEMGDGLLAEFPSVVDAVDCATAIQDEAAGDPDRLPMRIGVNVGDVVVAGDDLFGDGVNVAARLQDCAEPGGVCLSDDAYRQARARLGVGFADGGLRTLKNIAEPVRVWLWSPRTMEPPTAEPVAEQQIRFCKSSDGVRIAYATVGSGPPLLKTSNWLTHLELDWTSPLWRELLTALARRNTLVRYDHRGTGLSDRRAATITFDAWLEDLEAVVGAAGLRRFPIFGISQGCATAISFAARHPEMVSRLVLMGGFTRGWRAGKNESVRKQWEALITVTRQGWGRETTAFRQIFTSLFAPTAGEEQKAWLDGIQRASASAENAAMFLEAVGDLDITPLLEQVSCPALVLHCRGDEIIPFDAGRWIAANLPNARFVPLESRNHILFPTDPAWQQLIAEIERFLAEPDEGG